MNVRFAWQMARTMIVCTLAACAPRGTRSDAAATDVGAVATNGRMLDAQLLKMVDERRADTALIDLLDHDADPARRARAMLAIGQVKLRARYASLRAMLVDPDTAVAANAAYALGIAKDTLAIAALAHAVAGAPDVVAREAAWSLGEIGDVARGAVATALGEGQSQPLRQSVAAMRHATVRAALLLATAKMKSVPFAVVVPWFADTASESVRAAAYVVGRSRAAVGVRALLTVRSHRDEETRQHVARGLAKSAAGDSLGVAAREALSALIGDDSPFVRANAARSLVSYGATAMRDVERALQDRDANVRVAATEGIQIVFARDSAAWQRAWQRDTTYRVRQQLLASARVAGSAALSAGEALWLRESDWRKRTAVLEARAADDKADRLAIARVFVRDSSARVRNAALQLVPTAASDADARALAEPLLVDGDVGVRSAALGIIARRARASDIDVALAALTLAAGDRDEDARVGALRVIAGAWTKDSLAVNAAQRARLEALPRSASSSARRAVALVTPLRAWSVTEESTAKRQVAEYARLVNDWYGPGARQPRATIHTERGDITIELFGADAPLVVEAFIRLARSGFYHSSRFHRVVPNFVVQDGASREDGAGGPGFSLRESWTRKRHERGALGLATSGPDTGGSQFYLCHSAQPHLDGAYTVFGRVISGFEIMDAIVQGDRMDRIEMRS